MNAQKQDHSTGPPLLLRALIVEDHPLDAELMVTLLEKGGYQVEFVLTDSPKSFRQHLETAEYDVILADYNLGNWTALDALESLRSIGKGIPLIVVTGSLGDEAAAEVIRRGAADLVMKERPARLPAVVQRVMEERRLREERQRAEMARRASEDHFRSFVENAPVGIYSTTPQGQILMANPTLLRMLGYENFEQLAACNLEDQGFNPGYPRQAFRERMEREGEVKGFEAYWTRRDGSVIFVRESARVVRGESGEVLSYDGIVEDITERKRAQEDLRRSQEELQGVLASIPDYLWSADMDRQGEVTYRYYSPVVEKITGRPPEFYLPGPERWLSTVHPADQPRLLEAIESLRNGQAPLVTEEYRIILPDGTVRWVRDSVQARRVDEYIRLDGAVSDITDRKQVEEALRGSEAELKEALLAAQMGIWEWTMVTGTVIWDENLYRLAGRDPKLPAPSYQEQSQMYAPESWKRLTAAVENALATGAAYELDLEIVRPDGAKRWVIGRGEPRRAASGQIVGLRGTVQDITERKRAEEEIALLKRSIDVYYDAAYWTDTDNRFVYVNDAGCRALGYEREELIGKSILDVNPNASPEGLEMVWEILRHRGFFSIESAHRRKDGGEFPVEIVATYVRFGGREFNCGFARDITERKRAEEALRRSEAELKEALLAAQMGVWEWTAATGTVTWDENLYRIAGRDPNLSPPNYQEAPQILARESWERLKAAAETTSATGTPFEVDLELLLPDGSKKWLIGRGKPLRDASGNITHFRGTVQDITERKRVEEDLRASEERFRTLITDAPVAIGVARNGISRFVNAEYVRLFGLQDPEEAFGCPILNEFAPQCHEQIMDILRRRQQGLPAPNEYESVGRRKDGSTFPMHVAVSRIELVDGPVSLGFLTDLTERKRAEEALRESDQRYKDFISHTNEGVWRIELEQPIPINLSSEEVAKRILQYGYLAECNDAQAHNLGFSAAEDVVGRRVAELLALSDEERMATLHPSARPGFLTRTFEVKRRDKRGNFKRLIRTEIPIVQNGMLVRVWGITRDVTELRRAEEALRESEERFRTTFESAGIGMALVSLEGHPFKSNPALRQMLGYSEEEFRCMAFTEFTHPDDRELDWGLYRELTTGKRDKYEIEKRYLKKDGGVVWGVLTVSLVKGRDGCPEYAVGMVQDITERKRADEALRQSEQRYRDFIMHSHEGVWRMELAQPIPLGLPEEEVLQRLLHYGYIAECNLAHARLFGASTPEELVGIPLEDLISDSDGERLESFRMSARSGWESRTVEFRGRDLAGNLKHLLRTEIPIIENGMFVRAWGITRDITEQKKAEEALRESEERFRLFMDNSPAVAWVKDEQGRYVYISGAYEKRTKVRREDHLGKTDFDLFPRATAEQFQRNDRAALDAGHPIEVIEESLSPEGKEWHWLSYKFPFHDASGQVFVAGIGNDITERKRMEKDLHDSLEQLRALAARLQSIREEERKRVAREIHDQLGQALTAIKIDISSLVRDLPPGDQQYSKRTSSILQLVDESIRSVRRISTELRPGILDDLGLVAAIEWAGEDFEARTGTKCRLDLSPDEIRVDPEQATAVFRIFQETLTNVARHANASKVEVRMAREDGALTLEVHDDGKGISGEKLSSRESLGILGMRERALLLGGEITISGLPGNGTTVRVRIPEARRT